MKWALLAPAVVLCVLFMVWPLVVVVQLSLQTTNFITTEFVGLRNYARIFTDSVFLRSVVNSLWYILLTTATRVGAALLITL